MDEISWESLGRQFRKLECLDDRMFVEWSNALLEWKVKKVPLPDDFEILLRYKLARYGMEKTFGVGGGRQCDWTSAIDRVVQLVDGIQMKTVEAMAENFDNELLLRLRLILGELQDLLSIEKLQAIPLREMEFCLAVFLLMFQDEEKYGFFKLLLRPTDVVKFLRVVVKSMQRKKNYDDEKRFVMCDDLEQLEKLKECYKNVENLFTLMVVENMLDNCDSASGVLEVLVSKITNRVECVSFEIPHLNRVRDKLVKLCRYSEKNNRILDGRILENLTLFKTLIELEIFLHLSKLYRRYLGRIRESQSLKQIKLLCRYVVITEHISKYHTMLYKKVSKFYSNIAIHLGTKAMSRHISEKLALVKHLETSCISFSRNNLTKIINIVESNVDVAKVHDLIDQEISRTVGEDTIVSVHELYNTLSEEKNFMKSFYYNIQPIPHFNGNNTAPLLDSAKAIQSILNYAKCSSIDELLVNYGKMPQHIMFSLQYLLTRHFEKLNKSYVLKDEIELLKGGHQIFYGRTFLSFLTTGHPSYEVFLPHLNLNIALMSLLITEIHCDILSHQSLFTDANKLNDVRHDGLNWVRIQDQLRKSLRKNGENRLEDIINEGVYPDNDLFAILGYCYMDTALKNVISKQLYNKLHPTSCRNNSKEIATEIHHRISTNDFKLNIALEMNRYDEALALSGKQISSFNERLFSWEPFANTLDQTEAGLCLWKLETFTEVVHKLIAIANVQSLTFLFSKLDKLLASNTETDLSSWFRLLRNLRERIRDSVMRMEEVACLNNLILSFIFEQNKISLENEIHMILKETLSDLHKLISPESGTEFDQTDIWMASALPYKIIDSDKLINQQKKLLLKFCLSLGRDLWTQPSHPNLSVMAYALAKECDEVLLFLMEWVYQNIKRPEEQFVLIIQQNSVEIFKLFLSKCHFSDEDTFKYISNALQEMFVKQVFVSRELQAFLWYKLSEYGFEKFCSNSDAPKNPTQWKQSCQLIIEDVRRLQHRSDRGKFLGVDNEILYHFRMIHNQLFYIKDKPHLRNLPLKEITSLVAVFLSSFHYHDVVELHSENFMAYRMVLNKLTIMKFLEFVAVQLEQYLRCFTNVARHLVAIIEEGGSLRKREKLQKNWEDMREREKDLPKLSDNIWNSLFSKKNSSLLNQNVEHVVLTILLTEPIVFIPQKQNQLRHQITRLYHRVKQLYSLRKIFKILQRISAGSDCSKEITVASLKRFNQIFGESIKNTKNSQNLPAKLNRALNHQLRDYILIVKKTRDITCHDYPLVKKFFPIEEQYTLFSRIKETQIRMLTVTVAMLLICTHSEYRRCLFGSLRQCRSLHQLKCLVRFVGDQHAFESDQTHFLNIVQEYHDEIQESLNTVPVSTLPAKKLESLERIKKNHGRRLGVIEKLHEVIEGNFDYKFREIQVATFSSSNIQNVSRLLEVNLLPKSDYNVLEFVESNWVVLDEDLNALTDDLNLLEQNVTGLISMLFNTEINRESMQEYHRRQEGRAIVDEMFDVLRDPICDKRKLECMLNSELDRKKYFENIFLIKHKMQAIRDVFAPISTSALNDKIKTLQKNYILELQYIFNATQRSILKVYTKYDCSDIESLIKNNSCIPQEATLAIEYWLLELCEILISTNQFQDNFHTIKHDLQMICGRNFRNYLAHDGLSYDILTCSSNLKVLINGLVMAKMDWKLFASSQTSSVKGISDPREMGPKWLEEQTPLGDVAFGREGIQASGRFWMPKGAFGGLEPLPLVDVRVIEYGSECMFTAAMHKGDFTLAARYLSEQSWGQHAQNFGYACLGGLLKYLYESGSNEELMKLIRFLEMENIGSYLFAGSQEFLSLLLTCSPFVLAKALMHSMLLGKPVEQLFKFIPANSEDCSHLQFTVLTGHIEYFKHLLKLSRIHNTRNDSELDSIIMQCARFGRLNMIQHLTTLLKLSQNSLDLALSIATRHQRWDLVSFLFTSRNANPWNYMNELYAGDLAIRMGNLKLSKKFFKILSKTEFNFQSLLSQAVEFGSVCIVEFLMKMGCDIWQNQKILLNANSNRKDTGMLDYVEELLFKFKYDQKIDGKLQEWMRLVHERQLLENFNESTRLFLYGYQRSKKMLKEIIQFGKMDDGCSVKKLESCCIKCNDPRVKTFRSINNLASLDINMQCLTPKGSTKTVTVQLEQQEVSSEFVFNVILDVFEADSKLPSILKLSKSYTSKPLPIFICYDLVKLVDQSTSSSALIGQFELESQEVRFIRVGSCLFIAEVGSIGSPTYMNGFFNSVNRRGHTIFNSLHEDADVELIKILLSTGVDLTVVDKNGKNALMLTLDALCSWEVLEFMLDYCVRKNVRNSQGIHIFEMQDHDGRTLLQYAILIRRLNVVAFLIDHGVAQTMHDKSGMFPIHYACLSGSLLIADTLIEHDKDLVNLPQLYNKVTPLMMAVNMENLQLVNLLLQKGADLSLRNEQGETAIAWAISMERYSILCQLLNHSKTLDIDVLGDVTGEQQSALQHTLLQDDEKIFKAVLERMVGCAIDANTNQRSLLAMKDILLEKDEDAMDIFDNVLLLGRTKISSYLKQCEHLYEQITGETLRRTEHNWQSDLMEKVIQTALNAQMSLAEIDDLD